MADKDPFDPLIEQISELIQLAREKSSEELTNTPLAAGIERQLDLIEDCVIKMGQIADEEVQHRGLTNKELARNMFRNKEALPKNDKRIVEKTLNLSHDALGLKYALSRAEYEIRTPDVKQFEAEKVSKKQTNKRKAKFKKIQGDKNWKRI